MKDTKRSLFMSVMSLLLCCSMLLGTTWAWFTDDVTSSKNKIQSGSLKVDLELRDPVSGEWNSVKENHDPLFDYSYWEPGYTDVKILKITNKGTLALKWVAQFVSETKLSALADVIDVYVLAGSTELNYPTSSDLTGYTKVGTVADFVNTLADTTNGVLTTKGEAAYLGIALKMRETADNAYQGLSLGGEFDIRIYATQWTSEGDSFGN